MTRSPGNGAINRLHFSVGAGFWCVGHPNDTGLVWYQIPAPIRTLFYSKPKTAMHVTGRNDL